MAVTLERHSVLIENWVATSPDASSPHKQKRWRRPYGKSRQVCKLCLYNYKTKPELVQACEQEIYVFVVKSRLIRGLEIVVIVTNRINRRHGLFIISY